MTRVLLVCLLALAAPAVAAAQARANAAAPADGRYIGVAYVETTAASADAARAALRRYRDDSLKQTGCQRVEIYEQAGRPGHWALVESWSDQRAFDARDGGVARQLTDALAPLRTSALDQRPYKALAVDSRPGGRGATTGRGAVFVVSHVDVSPGPQVPVLLSRLAEASRQERGNLRFDVYQHTMRANHFTVVEAWENERALEAHAGAAHTKQYRDELQPFTGSPLDERVYRAVE